MATCICPKFASRSTRKTSPIRSRPSSSSPRSPTSIKPAGGVARAIDGDATTAWGIHPQEGKPHQAVFTFDKPVGFPGGTTFTVELDQSHGGSHLIGRFRLSLTTAAPMVTAHRVLPSQITAILNVPEGLRADAQRASVAQWLWEQQIERDLAALPAQGRVYCGTNRFTAEGSFRPSVSPRLIYVLKRGEVTHPGDLVGPGAVEAVPPGLQARFKLRDSEDEGQRRGPPWPTGWRTRPIRCPGV